MKPPALTVEQCERKIAYWGWLRREFPNEEVLHQVADYVIAKHSLLLEELLKARSAARNFPLRESP